MYNCLSRYTPETHEHVAGMLSNLQNKKTEATDNSEASTSEFTHQTTYLKCDHGEVS